MDLEELSAALVLWAVRVLRHTVSRQGVHGQLVQRAAGGRRPFQATNRRVLPGGLRGVRAGMRRPSAVAEAWYPRVRGRGRERTDELPSRLPADFLVLLDVDVDDEDGHSLGHNEGEGAKVERPSIGVSVLLVIVTFVVWVSSIAGDVNDDANYVAKTWKIVRKNKKCDILYTKSFIHDVTTL